MIHRNPESETSTRFLMVVMGALAAMILMVLISCSESTTTEVQNTSDVFGLVTVERKATVSECENGGQAVDMYVDLDRSKTYSTGDRYLDTVYACNAAPVVIPPGKTVEPTPISVPSVTPTPTPKGKDHETHPTNPRSPRRKQLRA